MEATEVRYRETEEFKEKNKQYAKDSRRRQKNYIKELENKVMELEQTVENLNFELWNIKRSRMIESPVPSKEEDTFDLLEMDKILRDRVKNSKEIEKDLMTEQFQNIIEKVMPSGEARK